jgi:hypothetical protein
LKTIRYFIERKTINSKENDLIVMSGDLNVNGGVVDKKNSKYYQMICRKPGFSIAMDDFGGEYNKMIDIFSNNDEDEVVDVMRVWNKGLSPITFADFTLDEDGNELPTETEMIFPEDYCSKLCLDYIF